jgi:predicted metal-binding protein
MRASRKRPATAGAKKYQKYIARAKKLGAKDARIIPASTIKTAEWVRLKCRFGCGGYDGCLTCPPHSPTPSQTREVVKCYKRALLVHGNEWTDVSSIVVTLERDIFLDGYHKAFAMGSGPCNLCRTCPETCKHPEKARPSMEACGIDVFATARANGFPIKVVRRENSKGDYYGVVLVE